MRGVIGSVYVLVLLEAIVATAVQLPPEILADRYLVEAEKLIAAKEPGKALEAMDKILALQLQHNLTLPDVFHFKYAELALSVGSIRTAIDAVNKYLGATGRDGEFYSDALELLVEAEQEEAGQKQEEVRRKQTRLAWRNRERHPYDPEMVLIPEGRFRMGCVSGRNCDDDESPVHEVRVEAFGLSKYEVTFEEYDRFTEAIGRGRVEDEGWGRGRRPVINVSWNDAEAYTRWLSARTGNLYRLPSEAEWEYAARAATETAYSWGNDIGHNRANCRGCGSRWDYEQTAPVGSFNPNAWGLHDMHGNVWEWVQDCWNGSYRGAPADGTAWERGDCSLRVLRGGSWYVNPRDLRSASRGRNTTSLRDDDVGFRVARTVTP